MGIVTLLSDFGTGDGYVAAMKGVLLSECPSARIVDATHEVPPQDVRAGAWALRHYWRVFPKESVHVAVVDPGVGSSRKPLLIRADGRWLVGPDNGLFSWVLREARRWEAWRIAPSARRPEGMGETFHGRDVFAYVAGRLLAGMQREKLAPREVDPIRFSWPPVRKRRGGVVGEIVHIDRFGNAVSNIPASLLAGRETELMVDCGIFHAVSLCRSYAGVPEGNAAALIESSGLLELSVNCGSAADLFGIAVGDKVQVRWG